MLFDGSLLVVGEGNQKATPAAETPTSGRSKTPRLQRRAGPDLRSRDRSRNGFWTNQATSHLVFGVHFRTETEHDPPYL